MAVHSQNTRQSRGVANGAGQTNGQVIPMDIKTCAAIINIYHLIPAATSKIIEPLTTATLKGEKSLYIEVNLFLSLIYCNFIGVLPPLGKNAFWKQN